MEFETIDSKTVYQGPVFDIHKDQVRLPDGRDAYIDIVEHRPAVTIVPVDDDGNIWFIQQYRHPAGEILLECPAGVMETGERPEISALRELREEIGMAAGKMINIGGFYLAPGYSTEYMHLFLAKNLLVDPLPSDENEFIRIKKIPQDHAVRLAYNGRIKDAKSLVAIFLAIQHLAKY